MPILNDILVCDINIKSYWGNAAAFFTSIYNATFYIHLIEINALTDWQKFYVKHPSSKDYALDRQ